VQSEYSLWTRDPEDDVRLTPADVEELGNAISPEAVRGTRYPEQMMALLNN
jgi:hypothetical protein